MKNYIFNKSKMKNYIFNKSKMKNYIFNKSLIFTTKVFILTYL